MVDVAEVVVVGAAEVVDVAVVDELAGNVESVVEENDPEPEEAEDSRTRFWLGDVRTSVSTSLSISTDRMPATSSDATPNTESKNVALREDCTPPAPSWAFIRGCTT